MSIGTLVRPKYDEGQSLTSSAGRRAIIIAIIGCFAVLNVDGVGIRSCLLDLLEKFE